MKIPIEENSLASLNTNKAQRGIRIYLYYLLSDRNLRQNFYQAPNILAILKITSFLP